MSVRVYEEVLREGVQGQIGHIDLGRIPNAAFAKVGPRARCNLMLPALYAQSDRTIVGRDLNIKFYEEVLRPALVAIDAAQFSHWPPDYESAERKARNAMGQYQMGTIDVAAGQLPELVVEMKLLMANIREFAGAFFYHESRGVKGGSGHDPADDDDVRAAFDEVCDHINWDLIPREIRAQFYIDVGIEIRRPRHVLQWRSGQHHNIMERMVPSATEIQRRAIMKSEAFHYDPSSQLSDFAGFRVAPGTRGRADGVVYMNVYCTEKEVHYQLHNGVFSRKKPADLLGPRLNRMLKDVDEWTKSFNSSTGVNGAAPQEGSARCEVRVQMRRFDEVLRGWDDETVQTLTSSIPSRVWWCVVCGLKTDYLSVELTDV